jgi:hypothetical protein
LFRNGRIFHKNDRLVAMDTFHSTSENGRTELSTCSVETGYNFGQDPEHSRRIVESIQSATTTKQRLLALRCLENAVNRPELGHAVSNHISLEEIGSSRWRELQASDLLSAGVLTSIAFQLHILIHRHGSALEEIRILCRCLALLCELCGSIERELVPACEKLGPNFISLLAETHSVVKTQDKANNQAPCARPSIGPEISLSLMKLFNGLSTCPTGAFLLQKCPMSLPCLSTTIADLDVHSIVALECLSALKNLTFYEEDCRIALLGQPGFYWGIANLSVRSHQSTKTLQRISSILKNLTIDAACRSQLTRQPTITSVIVRLAITTQRKSDEEIFQVDLERLKHNVLDVMVALLLEPEFGLLLILHGDGVLLDILRRFLDSESEDIRKRASTAIRLLTQEFAIPIIALNMELMHALAEMAFRDESDFVRRELSEAFRVCISHSSAKRKQGHFEAIVDAMGHLASNLPSPVTHTVGPSVDILCEAVRNQSTNVRARVLFADQPRLLQVLSEVLIHRPSKSASSNIAEALLNLSEDEKLVVAFAQKETGLVDALLLCISDFSAGESPSKRKKLALRTLINCSRPIESRGLYARHPMLIQTLIQATRSLTDSCDLRSSLKSAISVLVSEL